MRRWLPVVVVLAATACDGATTTQPVDLDTSPAFARGGAALVSGSVHIFLPDPLRDGRLGLREVTVDVQQRRDGTVGGTMHLGSVTALRPGLSFIGEVTCATVEDNGDGTKDAWIGGTNRHTNFGGNDLGDQFAVRVRDVGSPQAGPDRVSGVAFAGLVGRPGVGDFACANTPAFGLFSVTSGNLTIR